MIEEVSYPSDLADWNAASANFYFELFGETQPQIDMNYAEVLPAKSSEDGSAQTASATPIYQYWWTLGHSGDKKALEFCKNLPHNEAAHVYMYFPLGGGWRIKELTASVKYLSPTQEHLNLLEKLIKFSGTATPLINDAVQLASVISPVVGPTAGSVLNAIAKLNFNTVPQVDDFIWSVRKVTTCLGKSPQVFQGIMWTLPKRMFTDIGGRITGSLALSFIPTQMQHAKTVGTAQPGFTKQPILANARIFVPHEQREISLPEHQATEYPEFVSLYIHPQAPVQPSKKDKVKEPAGAAR